MVFIVIKPTSILSDSDWQNLNGNETYVQMLRNKVKIEIQKQEVEYLMGESLEYLKEVPEDLVYYEIEDVFGHKTIYVYFCNPVDKENFIHYYNTQLLVEKVTK